LNARRKSAAVTTTVRAKGEHCEWRYSAVLTLCDGKVISLISPA